tara:strand:- start:714 stop:944 length:231 start_codon:yes stop_codon:yes gene_type:complete
MMMIHVFVIGGVAAAQISVHGPMCLSFTSAVMSPANFVTNDVRKEVLIAKTFFSAFATVACDVSPTSTMLLYIIIM